LQFASRSARERETESSEEPLGVNTVVVSVFADREGDIDGAGVGQSPVRVPDGASEDARIEETVRAVKKELDGSAAGPGRKMLMLNLGANLRFEPLAKLLAELGDKLDRRTFSAILFDVFPHRGNGSEKGWRVCSSGWDKSTLPESRLRVRIVAEGRSAASNDGTAVGPKPDDRSCRDQAVALAAQAAKQARYAPRTNAGPAKRPVRLVIEADGNVPFAVLQAVTASFVEAGFDSLSLELGRKAAEGQANEPAPRTRPATREVAFEIGNPFPFRPRLPEHLKRFDVGKTPIEPAELDVAPLILPGTKPKAGSKK
jgi:hypothetical protein